MLTTNTGALTHHGQLVHQLPLPLQAAVEAKAADADQREAKVAPAIPGRHARRDGRVRAVQAKQDDRHIGERVDELGDVLLSAGLSGEHAHSCSGSSARTSLNVS